MLVTYYRYRLSVIEYTQGRVIKWPVKLHFLRFFSKSKNRDVLTFFWVAVRVFFSNTGCNWVLLCLVRRSISCAASRFRSRAEWSIWRRVILCIAIWPHGTASSATEWSWKFPTSECPAMSTCPTTSRSPLDYARGYNYAILLRTVTAAMLEVQLIVAAV